MALTGPPSIEPGLGPPVGMLSKLDDLSARLERASAEVGQPVRIDPLAELALRAPTGVVRRGGRTTCGGAGRLLRSADGWIAWNLARPEDIDTVAAVVEAPTEPATAWSNLEGWCAGHRSADAIERAGLLGMAAGALGETTTSPHPDGVRRTRSMETKARPSRLRVLDLSAIWAGPLCGALFAAGGHDVVKLESVGRPDGTRLGPALVFDRLNAGKRSVAVDLGAEPGRTVLHALAASADVVITAARSRALESVGLDPTGLTGLWIAITAHGATGPGAQRVGFGDDAAVAGGLVAWHEGEPYFCADAIADPLTGIVAATVAYEVLAAGDAAHLDVAMAAVASTFAGPTSPVAAGFSQVETSEPGAGPAPRGQGRPLGADTHGVLREWIGSGRGP